MYAIRSYYATLILVEFRDLFLGLNLKHILHRRFPGRRHLLFIRRSYQAHIEAGATAHGGDIDDLNRLRIKMISYNFV